MGIKAAIFGAIAGVMLLMGLALYLTGQAYLAERDQRVGLEFAAELTGLTLAHKADKEEALKAQAETYNELINEQENIHNERTMGITMQLVTARQDALQKPIQFGDDLFHKLIYADCMWNKGEAGTSLEGRDACSREAENADPTSTGLSFTTLTPTFLTGWARACEEWPTVGRLARPGEEDLAYTRDDWNEEFGNMDPALCYETLVALTPEASLFLTNFINNGSSYIERLIIYAQEQNEVIDILTRPKPDEPAQK